MVEQPKRTYEELKQDTDTIDSMYYVLKDLGQEVEYNPTTVLDAFLTQKRYFDTNIFSTGNLARKVDGFDDDGKRMLAKSLQEVEKLPTIFEDGSAPTASAIGDYFLAGISDPTNVASMVAGAFTLGAGGATALAAKEAAKQGIKKMLGAKMRAAVSAPVLKALAVEGAVAGAGGAAQANVRQGVEQEIDMRTEKDVSEMVLQGVVEGVLSPVAGVATNIAGSVLGKTIGKGVTKLEDHIPAIHSATEMIKRNFLPAAGVSDPTRRGMEIETGAAAALKDRGQALSHEFDKLAQKGKYTLEEQNAILEGKASSLSPELRTLVSEVDVLRKDYQDFAQRSGLSAEMKKSIVGDDYLRSVPEVFFLQSRTKSLDTILKNNPSIREEVRKLMHSKELPKKPGVAKKNLSDKDAGIDNPVTYADRVLYKHRQKFMNDEGVRFGDPSASKVLEEDAIDAAIKEMYTPTRKFRKETGAFIAKTDIPDAVKAIMGYNDRPALRIMETVNGIVDVSAKANVARFIAKDSGSIKTKDMAEAVAHLGTKDVTKLVSSEGGDTIFQGFLKDTPFRFEEKVIADELEDLWVTTDYAKQIKELTDESNPFFSNFKDKDGPMGKFYRFMVGSQGFMKAGKTVFSPLAIIRNKIGADMYLGSSGNFRALGDAKGYLEAFSGAKGKAAQKSAEADWLQFEKLGLRDSNLDVNQVMRRMGDLSHEMDDKSFTNRYVHFGKFGKQARDFYSAIDNAAKFIGFRNETKKASKIFDGMSKQKQGDILAKYGTKEEYGFQLAGRNIANVTPVYGRIPPILEKMRAFPIAGSFTAYPAERLRNTYNILKLATDEMVEGFQTGNAALRNTGMSRLGQWYTTQAAMYGTAYAANAMMGDLDIMEEVRKTLPGYKENNALLSMGQNKKGQQQFLDLSYINADQYVIEGIVPMFLKAGRGEDVSEDLGAMMQHAGEKLYEPYLGTLGKDFMSSSLLVQAGKQFSVMIEEGGFATDRGTEAFGKLMKTVSPGVASMGAAMGLDAAQILEHQNRATSELERGMRPRAYANEEGPEGWFDMMKRQGLGIPGLKLETHNPQKALGFALNHIGETAEKNSSSFSRDLKSLLLDDRSRYDRAAIVDRFKDTLRDQFAMQSGVKDMLDGMENLIGSNELFKITRDSTISKMLPAKDIRRVIKQGYFRPTRLDNNATYWNDINKDTDWKYEKEIHQMRQELRKVLDKITNTSLHTDPDKVDELIDSIQ